MARFKLLAGKHVGPDLKAEPEPVYNNMTGEQRVDVRTKEPEFRQPSKTYKAGQVVESDDDLVARFGANKFQLLSGTPKAGGPGIKRKAAQAAESPAILSSSNPAIAPGGQVSSGFQQTSGVESPLPGGAKQVSGPLDVEDEGTAAASGADLENSGEGPGDGEDADTGGTEYTRAELEGMTKAELKQLGDDEGIDVNASASKDEMVKAIVRGSRKKAK